MLKLSRSSRLIVITDVDGTLIDQRTYSYELSLPAVRRLQAKRIPIVLCSTKTSAEIILLWRELELDDPFICENGGAIYMPRDYLKVTLLGLKTDGPFEVLELGTDVDRLRHALADAAGACGVVLRTFGQMEVDEIATLTGLSLDQAARALERRYDEPFLVESGDSEKMAAMLRAKKLTVTKGDRFYHLSGGHSKRDAVEALLNLHRDQYGQVDRDRSGKFGQRRPDVIGRGPARFSQKSAMGAGTARSSRPSPMSSVRSGPGRRDGEKPSTGFSTKRRHEL